MTNSWVELPLCPGRAGRPPHTRVEKALGKDESIDKKAELFQQIGRLQVELELLKKVSAALMPVN